MWSQSATALAAAALLLGCEAQKAISSDVSDPSPPADSPDLLLHQVAFARLADGRVTARGTATQLGYRRAGGRLDAQLPSATLYPEPATGYSMFGDVQVTAPRGAGDLTAKRGTASGGVRFVAARGDRGTTERILWDGPADQLSGDRDVEAQGPGYAVRSRGFSAHADGRDITLTGGVSGTLEPEPAVRGADGSTAASRAKRAR
ncbi:MAG TPA: LPS export ABC transporter periplasmic protein LptC [Myxococcales bacterium]|jgi:hypothetical protein|nr:LPS export ABC transporter periplasmic protein LptC [Myxococcales bacterium]